MRCAIVTETYPPEINGVALTVQSLEEGLRGRGHSVDVIRPRQRSDQVTLDHETLVPGMIFTIEPMINLGRPHVKVLADGWTAVTRDRMLSAQYEHSLGVTATGCEIFTLSPKGLHRPGIDQIAA